MRELLAKYEQEGATVRIEFDTGGAVGGNYLVAIATDEYQVTRWFYFDEFNEAYARNFAEKIITDEQYRTASLNGTADWKQVAEIYEPAARRIYTVFEEQGLVGYQVGNDAEERRFRDAKQTWERLCEEVFTEINDRIRNSEPLDDLDAFIDDRVTRAEEKAEQLASEDHH